MCNHEVNKHIQVVWWQVNTLNQYETLLFDSIHRFRFHIQGRTAFGSFRQVKKYNNITIEQAAEYNITERESKLCCHTIF